MFVVLRYDGHRLNCEYVSYNKGQADLVVPRHRDPCLILELSDASKDLDVGSWLYGLGEKEAFPLLIAVTPEVHRRINQCEAERN